MDKAHKIGGRNMDATTKALAQRIHDYTDPWAREETVEQIARSIQNDPEAVINYLLDIIEDLTE
jgi:hypothetical protein